MHLLLAVSLLQDGLSDEGRRFAAEIVKAEWTESVESGGVAVRMRKAALFSRGMINAVANAAALTADERAALSDMVRVTLPERGWLFRAAVPKGTVRLGIAAGLKMTLTDEQGRLLDTDPIRVGSPSDDVPVPGVKADDSARLITLECNGTFAFRFIPASGIELAGRSTTTSGGVSVSIERAEAALGDALAREAGAALASMSEVLGRKPPAEPFRVHVFTDGAAFDRVMRLLGNRDYASGFASSITKEAFVHVWVRRAEPDTRDLAVPAMVRRDVLHELYHLLSWRLWPGAERWPLWLAEGLAELCTREGLTAQDRAAFDDYHLGRWRDANLRGALPDARDLLQWKESLGPESLYASAYFVVRRLHEQKELVPILEAFEKGTDPGDLDAIWKNVRDATLKAGTPPASMLGALDRIGGPWRLVSAEGGDALMLFTEKALGKTASIETRFLWRAGARETHVVAGYQGHRATASFVRVVVTPTAVSLDRGQRPMATTAHDVALNDDEWHALKVTFGTTVVVSIGGKKVAEFDLEGGLPDKGRVGLGCRNGTTLFERVTLGD